MEEKMDRKSIRRLLWGLFLIAVGTAFMLQRYGVVDMPRLEEMWPAIFWVSAIGRAIDGRIGSAVTLVSLGAWFFACTFGWMGLDYHNSWPLVLVAVGVGIMIKALTGEDRKWKLRHTEERHES